VAGAAALTFLTIPLIDALRAAGSDTVTKKERRLEVGDKKRDCEDPSAFALWLADYRRLKASIKPGEGSERIAAHIGAFECALGDTRGDSRRCNWIKTHEALQKALKQLAAHSGGKECTARPESDGGSWKPVAAALDARLGKLEAKGSESSAEFDQRKARLKLQRDHVIGVIRGEAPPQEALPTLEKLLDRGHMHGLGKGLQLHHDCMRSFVATLEKVAASRATAQRAEEQRLERERKLAAQAAKRAAANERERAEGAAAKKRERAELAAAEARARAERAAVRKKVGGILRDCTAGPLLRSARCAALSELTKKQVVICNDLCAEAGKVPIAELATQRAEACFSQWSKDRTSGLPVCQAKLSKYSKDVGGMVASVCTKECEQRVDARNRQDERFWSSRASAKTCTKPKTSTDCDVLKSYLEEFPAGIHVKEAKSIVKRGAPKIKSLAAREEADRKREEAREEAKRKREEAREAAKRKSVEDAFRAVYPHCQKPVPGRQFKDPDSELCCKTAGGAGCLATFLVTASRSGKSITYNQAASMCNCTISW
jgi:hypothetical protein